ncbi:MAG: aminoacyl-tRNA hydrolase [Leptospira sp.]|nr:aminoacyl-tRNA hydrolase [Leptospira sp.]
MKKKLLIAGLGNPGNEYEGTRHSIGFVIIDALCDTVSSDFSSDKKCAKALVTSGETEIILIKPMEYMNLSGNAVLLHIKKSGLNPENLLVIHDEIDLPFGTIKMKSGGGHAGHNGLRDIIDKLGSREFHRLRFGVGRPGPGGDVADYVLSRFSVSERLENPLLVRKSVQLIQNWIDTTS